MDVRSFNKKSPTVNKPMGTVQTNIPPISQMKPEDSKVTQAQEALPATSDIEAGDAVIMGYLDYLAEHDISKADVFKVLDTIITTGEVYWQFDLLGKIPVVFKMRPAWVNEQLIKQIEQEQPKTISRFSDIVSVYNLAGSLVNYQDRNYEVKEEADLTTNIAFVMSLPFIMQNRLVAQMAIFDRVIAVATSDWAVENFTKPLSAE